MALVTDRQKCAHLLRRFALGASEAELDFYMKDGLKGAIDRLLDFDHGSEGFAIDINDFRAGAKNQINMGQVVGWWGLRLLMTQYPLREKMSLFWHDHFATSASKVGAPLVMYQQNEILRKNATGSFRTMLNDISKDPAMLIWLDNQENVKGRANENFAREVMELFTLGIGNYTEKDIQEGARAFTGWAFRRIAKAEEEGKKATAEYFFRARLHDDGVKSFRGQQANFSGEDVLNILCDDPRTSQYITYKIWEWFVYPKPEAAVVDKFAKIFRDSNLNIATLLRAIMTSTEFYSAKAERAVVKNPVDFCVVTLRQLGVGEMVKEFLKSTPQGEPPRQAAGVANLMVTSMRSIGMWLMYPPDVAGWDGGEHWITSATMLERISWADRIFGQSKVARLPVRYQAFDLFREDPTPGGVTKALVSIFDAPMSPQKLNSLISAATRVSNGTITPENANATAAQVARLIFSTPEFQFS